MKNFADIHAADVAIIRAELLRPEYAGKSSHEKWDMLHKRDIVGGFSNDTTLKPSRLHDLFGGPKEWGIPAPHHGSNVEESPRVNVVDFIPLDVIESIESGANQ